MRCVDESEGADMTDRELMRAFWSIRPNDQMVRTLTYTQWKDGIDVQVPTLFLRQLADAIAAAMAPTGEQYHMTGDEQAALKRALFKSAKVVDTIPQRAPTGEKP
jgi:hypothetical protein